MLREGEERKYQLWNNLSEKPYLESGQEKLNNMVLSWDKIWQMVQCHPLKLKLYLAAQIKTIPIKFNRNSSAADLQTVFQMVSIHETLMN